MKTMKTCLLLLFVSLFCIKLNAQSFLKSYGSPFNATTPISFECITEKTDAAGFRYIVGHVSDSIIIFKTDNTGGLISQYRLFKLKPYYTRLDGIIIDSRGDLVVIGNYEFGGTALHAFIFKYTPGNPTTTWFKDAAPDLVFTDIVEKIGTSTPTYYVSGQSALANGLILKVNGTTGALSNITPSHYTVNGVESALSLSLVGNIYHVAGRYAVGVGTQSFRSVYSRFNNTGHLGTTFYIKNNALTDTARMYNSDMLISGSEAIMVGQGDDNGILDPYKTLQITKANSANGNLIWCRKYDIAGAASDGALCEIRSGLNGGYIVMGFLLNNGNIQPLGKAFLMSLDVNGNILWSKSYGFTRRATITGANNQFNFTTDRTYIYAVGEVTNSSGIAEGALLKVELSNGNLINSTTAAVCDSNLNFIQSTYNFAAPIGVTFITKPYIQQKSTLTMQFTDFSIKDLCAGCTLTVNAGPDLGTCCPSAGTQLTAVASGGTPTYNYSWSPAAGLSNPNIANPVCFTTGTFTVTVTDASGVCIASDAVTVTAGGISCCRIASGKNKSQAYPNPFNNGFILKMPANTIADLQIVNLYGMPLEVKRKASGTVQMGSKLAYGAFTLLVTYSDGTREELKIIKSPQ